jgi:hypothetical protein
MKRISAVINFHREGPIANHSIVSYLKNVENIYGNKYEVIKIAVLDNPDLITREIVEQYRKYFDFFEIVSYGDFGKSKNHAFDLIESDYIAYFDGDDLWSKDWLSSCLESEIKDKVVLHPEFVYYFNKSDFGSTALFDKPSNGCNSFYMRHIDSNLIDKRKIYLNNMYTSNIFTSTKILRKFPFLEKNIEKAHGVEDWAWNAITLYSDIHHSIVKDVVHIVRVKTSNSLGLENSLNGLLPPLYQLINK